TLAASLSAAAFAHEQTVIGIAVSKMGIGSSALSPPAGGDRLPGGLQAGLRHSTGFFNGGEVGTSIRKGVDNGYQQWKLRIGLCGDGDRDVWAAEGGGPPGTG